MLHPRALLSPLQAFSPLSIVLQPEETHTACQHAMAWYDPIVDRRGDGGFSVRVFDHVAEEVKRRFARFVRDQVERYEDEYETERMRAQEQAYEHETEEQLRRYFEDWDLELPPPPLLGNDKGEALRFELARTAVEVEGDTDLPPAQASALQAKLDRRELGAYLVHQFVSTLLEGFLEREKQYFTEAGV